MRLAALLLISLGACRSGPSAPAPAPAPSAPEAGGVEFAYVPPPGAPPVTSVVVAGSFNQWSTGAAPMQRRSDGSWAVRLRLAPGRHRYKFHINGAWPSDMCHDRTWGDPARGFRVDPGASECVPDGEGGRNAEIEVAAGAPPPAPTLGHDPRDPAHLSAAGGHLSVRLRAPREGVRSATVRAAGGAYPMHRQLAYGAREVWRATLPEGTRRYRVSVRTAQGERDLGPFAVPAELFRAVPWVGGSVGYQIFPDRFRNGDRGNDVRTVETDEHALLHPAVRGAPPVLTREWNGPVTEQHCCHQYFGGDLQGIIDRLDHLQSLGVTLLYLNPIFSAGSAHGYDTFSYHEVEPGLGDEAVLRRLVEQARARGIRLVWDFVPNHVGVGHPAFQDAVRRGPASPHWRWFEFTVPHDRIQVGNGSHYRSWAGSGSLPKLNTRDPGARAHLMEVVRRWTRFGFDGIRVDVPNELVDAPAFFRELRRTARAIDPDAYLVGEIWQRAPEWLQGDQFDALMNYAIGQEVVERFVTGRLDGEAALEEMAQLYAEYPEASTAMQFNVIATHDTGRLLTKVGGGGLGATPGADALARQRLASAFLFSLPGVPVTFQGDECAQLGAGGARSENRYPVQWDACDPEMVAHYRRLARLKREVAALSSPAIRLHHGEGALLSYLRGEPGAGELLAVFNAGSTRRTLELPPGSWTDLVSGEGVNDAVEVDPLGWRYLRRG